MSSQTLNDYFTYINSLSRSLDSNPGATRALLHLIEQYKDEAADNRSQGEFFKGEYAFYSGQYERALKHYLEAKNVEDFEFFCYRASAYVSQAQGNLEKAVKFAEKARVIFPNDFPTLSLLKKLFEQSGRLSEAEHLNQHIQTLQVDVNNEALVAENAATMTLGENEIKELAGIFEPHFEEQLFAEEVLRPKEAISSSFDLPYQHSSACTNDAFKEGLDSLISSFQCQQSELLDNYMKAWEMRPTLPDYCLYIFQGWHQQAASISDLTKFSKDSMPFWLAETLRKSSGGFYLRWNGKGLAVNPGRNFIKELHHQGLHVKDIDYVISTNEHADSYAEIKEIWELNYRLNSTAGTTHIIHYYLNQHVHRTLSSSLKLHFKQERDAIHCLELFIDSPDVEKVDLQSDIRLHYFSCSNGGTVASGTTRHERFTYPLALGIKLELTWPAASDSNRTLNIGYVSETAWFPLLGHRLGYCDIVLAGFGNTSSTDFNKQNYEEENLGYFGSYSLLEEVSPRLFLCTEFGGREGDIRLEIVRRMREEYAKSHSSKKYTPVILPADTGLFVDLAALCVKCSTSSSLVDIDKIRVTNPSGTFGRLSYLAPECCL